MGHKDKLYPPVGKFVQHVQIALAARPVQTGARFVQQQHARRAYQCPCQKKAADLAG